MGEIKTYWTDPVLPDHGLAGQGITDSGSDRNADGNPGPAAVDFLWKSPVVPIPGGEETANSVSGLPSLPTRWEPNETPPEPPSLQDRNPGTIDQR